MGYAQILGYKKTPTSDQTSRQEPDVRATLTRIVESAGFSLSINKFIGIEFVLDNPGSPDMVTQYLIMLCTTHHYMTKSHTTRLSLIILSSVVTADSQHRLATLYRQMRFGVTSISYVMIL